MPVYEYRCKSCGTTHEIEHGFHDKRPTECPTCGGELVRVFHPIGLVFKGSGFHKTDYGGASVRSGSSGSGDSGGDAKPADSKGGEGKPSESKPQSEGKSDKKSPDTSSSAT
jgi:putative FmdB family regulatory protein